MTNKSRELEDALDDLETHITNAWQSVSVKSYRDTSHQLPPHQVKSSISTVNHDHKRSWLSIAAQYLGINQRD